MKTEKTYYINWKSQYGVETVDETNDYKNAPFRHPDFCGEDGFEVLLKVALEHNNKQIGYLYVEDDLSQNELLHLIFRIGKALGRFLIIQNRRSP